MKKVFIVLPLFLILASLAFAQSAKYQIVSEKKGLFGLGGKTTIMLDKETGDSWLYQDNKWVAIPKITPEASVQAGTSAEDVKAAFDEEIAALTMKQVREIEALKLKLQEALKNSSRPGKSLNTRTSFAKKKYTVKKRAVEAASPAAAGETEEGPPAWLNE